MAESRETAVDLAARALAHRDRSEADVRRILETQGFSPAEADDALATLQRVGALDDDRFARRRADALAARGYGDAAIVVRLEQEGIGREAAGDAVAKLQPEAERAARLAARKGGGPRTARWLARRGFATDSIESVSGVAGDAATELG